MTCRVAVFCLEFNHTAVGGGLPAPVYTRGGGSLPEHEKKIEKSFQKESRVKTKRKCDVWMMNVFVETQESAQLHKAWLPFHSVYCSFSIGHLKIVLKRHKPTDNVRHGSLFFFHLQFTFSFWTAWIGPCGFLFILLRKAWRHKRLHLLRLVGAPQQTFRAASST